uniref:Uncharacterized protein n=1 Tax=Rhabditophanes sp. KR3021 TaxID=114890 RepID=A0AC35UGM5_9BILA
MPPEVQKRPLTSYDRSVIEKIEDTYHADYSKKNYTNIYDKLFSRSERYNYLHKMDDLSLHQYKNSLKNQVDRLEQIRDLTPWSSGSNANIKPSHTSWFFKPKSIPNLDNSFTRSEGRFPMRNSERPQMTRTQDGNPILFGNKQFGNQIDGNKLPPLVRIPKKPKPNYLARKLNEQKNKLPLLVSAPSSSKKGMKKEPDIMVIEPLGQRSSVISSAASQKPITNEENVEEIVNDDSQHNVAKRSIHEETFENTNEEHMLKSNLDSNLEDNEISEPDHLIHSEEERLPTPNREDKSEVYEEHIPTPEQEEKYDTNLTPEHDSSYRTPTPDSVAGHQIHAEDEILTSVNTELQEFEENEIESHVPDESDDDSGLVEVESKIEEPELDMFVKDEIEAHNAFDEEPYATTIEEEEHGVEGFENTEKPQYEQDTEGEPIPQESFDQNDEKSHTKTSPNGSFEDQTEGLHHELHNDEEPLPKGSFDQNEGESHTEEEISRKGSFEMNEEESHTEKEITPKDSFEINEEESRSEKEISPKGSFEINEEESRSERGNSGNERFEEQNTDLRSEEEPHHEQHSEEDPLPSPRGHFDEEMNNTDLDSEADMIELPNAFHSADPLEHSTLNEEESVIKNTPQDSIDLDNQLPDGPHPNTVGNEFMVDNSPVGTTRHRRSINVDGEDDLIDFNSPKDDRNKISDDLESDLDNKEPEHVVHTENERLPTPSDNYEDENADERTPTPENNEDETEEDKETIFESNNTDNDEPEYKVNDDEERLPTPRSEEEETPLTPKSVVSTTNETIDNSPFTLNNKPEIHVISPSEFGDR